MKEQSLNVGEVVGNQDIDVKISTKEHPDERASRLKREEENAVHQHQREELEAAHQRQKDFYLFLVTIGVVIAAFCACLFIALSGKFNAEMEKCNYVADFDCRRTCRLFDGQIIEVNAFAKTK